MRLDVYLKFVSGLHWQREAFTDLKISVGFVLEEQRILITLMAVLLQ